MPITSTRSPRGLILLRANECVNPSFEVDTTGWDYTNNFGTGGAGADGIGGGFGGFEGTTSIYKLWSTPPTGTVNDVGFRYIQTGWTVGMTKTVSGYMKASTVAVGVAIKLRYISATNTVISQPVGPAVTLTPGQWTRVSTTGTAPAGTASVQMYFELLDGYPKPGVNMVLQLDAVLIEPGTTLASYFSGATYSAGFGDLSTQWEGTANNSRSLLYQQDPAGLVQPQLVIGYDVSQPSRNIVHQLIDGGVVASLFPATTRSGVLKLFFLDAASCESALIGHYAAAVWTYVDTDQPQENMTYVVDGTMRKYQSENRKRWTLEIPYRELS